PLSAEKKRSIRPSESNLPIFILTEQSLRDLIKDQAPPSLKRIESAYLRAALDSETLAEKYALTFEGESRYYNSNEAPFFIYAPVVSPVKSASIGFSKSFSTGMKVGVYNTWEEKKFSSFGVHGRNSASVRFEMDLFKNLFGRKTLSELNNATLEREISLKEKEIATRTFSIAVEKLYWNLVTTQEHISLLEDLIKSIEKQTLDVKRRYNSGVADSGDLARQKASLASYRSEMLNLEYQKESLHQEMKEMIPFLSDKDIVLGEYDLIQKEVDTLDLIKRILELKETPLDLTSYDEISSLLTEAKEEQLDADATHSDLDISFYSEYTHMADDPDFSTAVSEMQDDGEESYAFGVKFSVPLTGEKRKSERLKKRISNLEYDSRKEDIDAKLNAYHFQTQRMLLLLEDFLAKQKDKTENLEKTMRSTRLKYGQARAELRDLIADQDLYLRTAMSEIDGKLFVIQRVLDYLTVFTKMRD
ncbi:MAG: TolC family protein, partial [Alphaproteobacteria bacterium]|nr:TolC family protein [Alphaproteobacteria bacterium]